MAQTGDVGRQSLEIGNVDRFLQTQKEAVPDEDREAVENGYVLPRLYKHLTHKCTIKRMCLGKSIQ